MAELETAPPQGEHFASAMQEREADLLGLWLFLATEVMMFGGLFMGIIVYRVNLADTMQIVSRHLNMILGGVNTAILLTSSLTMALAVVAARQGLRRRVAGWLTGTAGLGLGFLLVKAYEYRSEYLEGLIPNFGPPFPLGEGAELIFNVYFASTGLHALHLLVGIAIVGVLAVRVATERTAVPKRRITVEGVGLYWHFVDVVWVFLYPILYLVGR